MPQPSSRAMWALFEPVHMTAYFSEQSRDAFAAAGLKGFWRTYFAARVAPLGPVPAPVVTALFFGFAHRMVSRAVPAIWETLSPEAAVRVRTEAAAATLKALPGWDESSVKPAADLARAAAEVAAVEGRALGAANAALPWPEGDPTAVLWQAATVLRELRGDGHVAALLAAGLSGSDSVVLRAGLDVDPGLQQSARGWTDEEWQSKLADLRGRGLLDGDARTTVVGWSLLGEVERVTNELAEQPWQALGPDDAARFAEAVAPFSRIASEALPRMTPIGQMTAEGPWAQSWAPPESGGV
jgi:helix-turn-helix protein